MIVRTRDKLAADAVRDLYGKGFPSDLVKRTRTLLSVMDAALVLEELYLDPLGMSAIALAKRLNVPRTRIERLVRGQTSLTADTAMRLSRFFGNTPEFWMNLQRSHDLARAQDAVDLSDITPLEAA